MSTLVRDVLILDDVRKSGIYGIFNNEAGKVYVGSAVNIARRYREHLRKLRNGKHHSPHLQHAWDKFGPGAFMFKAICFASPDEIIDKEQYFIDFFQASWDEVGYNVCPTAGSSLGRVLSTETKEKIAAKRRGKQLSLEHRAAISAGAKGKTCTEQARENYKKAQQGFGGGNARLSEADVFQIRTLFAEGISQKVLAEQFGVNRGYVSLIVTKKRWRHI